jgi:hypothetical protein
MHLPPIRLRTLDKVWHLAQARNEEFPNLVVVQVDNTVAQARNNISHLFMAVLVGRELLASCDQNSGMVGHTHEDVDQLFALISAFVLRKKQYLSPSAIATFLQESLEPRFAARNEKFEAEVMTGVRSFTSWLAPLAEQGIHLHNAFMTRGGKEAPHSFSYRRTESLSSKELEMLTAAERQALGTRDVSACVKTYVRDLEPQQPPVLIVKPHELTRLQPEPQELVLRKPLSSRALEGYLTLAQACEKELDMPVAAVALRDLVHAREYTLCHSPFLTSPRARQIRTSMGELGHPYFPHLPKSSWRLLARA